MSNDFLVKFGSTVRELRKLKGLSQEKLAFEVGMDLTSINEIENGRRNPTLRTIIRIARALGVKPDELLSGL
jgi:transcriptional regulator with XRE-family HTH domain